MKRKLIKQGTGEGLVVYLPREWIKNKSLKQGDEIDIEEFGEDMIISTKKKSKTKKEVKLKILHANEKVIRLYLKNYFKSGYKKIILEYEQNELKYLIEDIIEKHFSGIHVTKEGKNEIELEVFSEIEEGKGIEFVEKLFFFIINSLEELSKDKPNLENIKKNSDKVSLYESLSKRDIVLNTKNSEKILHYWSLITYFILLDRIIAIYSKHEKKILKEEIKILIQDMKKVHKFYLRKKPNDFPKINMELQSKQEKYLKLISENNNSNYHHLYNISRHIYLLLVPIFGVIS